MSKWERIPVYIVLVVLLTILCWPDSKEVTLEKLTIENRNGDPVILLETTSKGSARLLLYDENGLLRNILGGGSLVCNGPDNNERVYIGQSIGKEGPGVIELRGGDSDAIRVTVGVSPKGNGAILLSNKDNQKIAGMGARDRGGFFECFSHDGMPLALLGGMQVPTGETYNLVNAGGLVTYGFTSKPIATLGISRKGNGVFSLYDKDSNVIYQYPK